MCRVEGFPCLDNIFTVIYDSLETRTLGANR